MLDHMVLLEVYDVLYEKYVTDKYEYNSDEMLIVYDVLNTIKELYLSALDDFETSYGGTE
jgi:hypothetical protein